MLVYGGTFHSRSNVADEDAQDLTPCDLNAMHVFNDGLNHCTTRKDLRLVLEYLASENMNIVGSCGKVYSSHKLANIVEGLHVLEANLLPQTCGLRRKFLDLLTTNNL